jgi:peptide-methionine (S)-S-oxide reductase
MTFAGRTQDQLFEAAVSAIDAGDAAALERLLAAYPRLACERLEAPGAWLRDSVGAALDGFFEKPYLLWFVAEDPVRKGRLPANIAGLARSILRAAREACPETLDRQLDYALRLVAWSWIARQSNVQIELIDVLVDAGASPEGAPDDALVNGNVAAAAHLVERGAPLTLATALCLNRWDEANALARTASAREKQFALTLAALRGESEALRRLVRLGVDVNAISPDLHSHATPLHHAVHSGSLDAVMVLVEAGAALGVKDTAYDGTALGWAEFGKHRAIATYLRRMGAR